MVYQEAAALEAPLGLFQLTDVSLVLRILSDDISLEKPAVVSPRHGPLLTKG